MSMKDHQFEYYSATLKRNIYIRYLIPEGSNLKCLVLLHGYNGDHHQWYNKSIISQLAEQYSLVVVTPHCGNGYYVDTQEDIPNFVGNELVSYIRKVLPISPKPDDTYIAGVSMGGFGALLIGAKFGNVFGKIASLSGAFIIPDVVIGNQGVLGNADPRYFKEIFGDFETLEGSDKDPLAVAIKAYENKRLPSLCLLCGTEDALYQGNLKVVKNLRKHGIPVVWYGGTGNHRWPFWNDMLPYVIKWLVEDYIPAEADIGDIGNPN